MQYFPVLASCSRGLQLHRHDAPFRVFDHDISRRLTEEFATVLLAVTDAVVAAVRKYKLFTTLADVHSQAPLLFTEWRQLSREIDSRSEACQHWASLRAALASGMLSSWLGTGFAIRRKLRILRPLPLAYQHACVLLFDIQQAERPFGLIMTAHERQQVEATRILLNETRRRQKNIAKRCQLQPA